MYKKIIIVLCLFLFTGCTRTYYMNSLSYEEILNNATIEENKQKMLEEIQSKKAFNKFKEMVKNQGGDVSYIEDTNRFPKAKYHTIISII